MGNDDTIKLLKECDAGSKMAVTSIDEVMDREPRYARIAQGDKEAP